MKRRGVEEFTYSARGKRKCFSFLLAGGLLLIPGAGCQRTALLPTDVVRSVQIEALLPLHPLWKQVEVFDRSLLTLQRPLVSPSPLRMIPLLPLSFRETPEENFSSQRQERIRNDATKYLRQLESYLRSNAAQRLNGEVRNLRRQREAEIALKVAARAEELRKQAVDRRAEIETRLRALKYHVVAYESQIRIALNPTRLRLEGELLVLRGEIAQLTGEAAALPTDFVSRAQQEFQPERNRIRNEVDAFRKRRAEELDVEVAKLLKSRSKLQVEQRDSIPPLTAMPTIPSLPDAGKTVAAIADPSPLTPPGTNVVVSARATRNWKAQRQRLIEEIRRDMEGAVAQEAKRKGWNLAPFGTPGSVDTTEEMRPLIVEQWQH